MAAKFLIVNNGMTEARGHFVETGVAIARAARARGFDVTMGVHAHCDGREVPADLPTLPMFRVDHWGHIIAQTRGAKAQLARLARRVLPSALFDRLRAASRARRGLPAKPWAEGGAATTGAESLPGDRVECLRFALGRIPPDHDEFAHYQMFGADLERFLTHCGAGPGDHMYFPTAHGRDAATVFALIARVGAKRLPTFHLEYRHAILSSAELAREPDPFRAFQTRTQRAYFDACRNYPESPNVRFYTDTRELATDYAALSGFEFDVLSIPFRAELIPNASTRAPTDPLRVLFLGDLREEKGFTKLPPLVRALGAESRHPRVQFVVPGALHAEERTPRMLAALTELEAYSAEQVERPHRDGFVPASDYYRLLASADVVLCPYDAQAYRARSSGVFAEAVAAGKPTIVPANTWMAFEQPPGTGETYTDACGLLAANQRVCADYSRYRTVAETARKRWLSHHTPENLVAQLLDDTGAATATARQTSALAEVAR